MQDDDVSQLPWLKDELSKLHKLTVTLQGNLHRLNRWRDQQLRLAAGHFAQEVQDAFNGQISKAVISQELISRGPLRLAVETGTGRGRTTRYLAGRFEHVVTFEHDEALIAEARQHCEIHPNISFVHGDSAQIRKAWQHISLALDQVDFVYLDAHGPQRSPLREELDFLLSEAPNAIIFVDDFRVETDSDYGWQTYAGAALELIHINDLIVAHRAACFWPARRGFNDTSVAFSSQQPPGALVIVPPARMAAVSGAVTVRPA